MHYSVCKYDSTHKREALDGKHVCKHISILLSLSERVAKNFANMTILYNACEFLHEQYRPICDAIPLQSDVKFGTMCASHWDIYQWPSPHLWKSYICVTWDIFPLWSRPSVNNAPLSFAPIFYMYLQRRTKISMRRSSFCITKFSYARMCVYSLKSECLTIVAVALKELLWTDMSPFLWIFLERLVWLEIASKNALHHLHWCIASLARRQNFCLVKQPRPVRKSTLKEKTKKSSKNFQIFDERLF